MPGATSNSGIRNNHRRGLVADFLRAKIRTGSRLSVVSAYFTIYAYEALRAQLDQIGRPGSTPATARFVPPPPEELENCVAGWERFLHESDLPPLMVAALMHYQFDAIHPFLDGSGRVGRLLVTLFLIERKILPAPLLYLSAFFEASRRDYYELLLGVSQRGEWSEWLQYFLNGVSVMSEDAIGRSARIVALLDEWRKLQQVFDIGELFNAAADLPAIRAAYDQVFAVAKAALLTSALRAPAPPAFAALRYDDANASVTGLSESRAEARRERRSKAPPLCVFLLPSPKRSPPSSCRRSSAA